MNRELLLKNPGPFSDLLLKELNEKDQDNGKK